MEGAWAPPPARVDTAEALDEAAVLAAAAEGAWAPPPSRVVLAALRACAAFLRMCRRGEE